ncbi:hypothetical protein WN51_00875 [Melipona quadrifasciata]|uniref:Uncharacterized protein n=1 Tax=Melipona quadrifasciata TaxID=166423 RepID=A0A0M9AB68_9HYME|nr:hypothetical protein WN51_00875 [Melipona quadrifasciata]
MSIHTRQRIEAIVFKETVCLGGGGCMTGRGAGPYLNSLGLYMCGDAACGGGGGGGGIGSMPSGGGGMGRNAAGGGTPKAKCGGGRGGSGENGPPSFAKQRRLAAKFSGTGSIGYGRLNGEKIQSTKRHLISNRKNHMNVRPIERNTDAEQGLAQINKNICQDNKKKKKQRKHGKLPRSSTPEGLWQTPTDRGVQQTRDEFCSPDCVTPLTSVSPRRKLFATTPVTPVAPVAPVTPAAPIAPVALRQLRRRPDLRSGVAIAARRLDFDTVISLLDEDEVSLELDESQSGILNLPTVGWKRSRGIGKPQIEDDLNCSEGKGRNEDVTDSQGREKRENSNVAPRIPTIHLTATAPETRFANEDHFSELGLREREVYNQLIAI